MTEQQLTSARMLRARILRKEITVGSWLSFGYTGTAEIMGRAGFDWMVIDMEHGAIDMGQARSLIQVLDLAGCPPLVRVDRNDPTVIKQALDAGAAGVVVPMVNTAEQARAAVSAAYYPPRGTRGVGLARAQGYGLRFEEYRGAAPDATTVLVQIEHIEAVRNLSDILAVDGVDGFIIGPYDLSGSLGHPGEFDHPEVESALHEIARLARSSGKAAGVHVVHPDRDRVRRHLDEGYTIIAYGDDMVQFHQKIAADYADLRDAVGAGTPR